MERQMAGGPDGPPALAFVWLEKLCFYLAENVRTNIVRPLLLFAKNEKILHLK